MRTRQVPCTFSPCHGTDSARIPLCDFPGGARWPPSCSRHFHRSIPCINCLALHSPGIWGWFVLSAWRLVASPLVTIGVICASDAAREAQSRPSWRLLTAPCGRYFPLSAWRESPIGWGCRLSGRNLEERRSWQGQGLWCSAWQGRWRAADDGITQHALVVCHGERNMSDKLSPRGKRVGERAVSDLRDSDHLPSA